MTATENNGNRQVIKEFATSVSTQAQVANRIWLSLMTVALVALLPREAATVGKVALPFGFGQVDASTFSVIVFAMLVVLTIAFSSAYAQQFRAQMLAHSFLDSISKTRADFVEADPRELFDMLRLPTFNRVAPLAQLARGPFQFFRDNARCPAWLRTITTIYYVLLKLTAMFVYFGLPAYALFDAYEKALPVGSWLWLLRFAVVLAMITLLQVFLGDLLSLKKVLPKIWGVEAT
jgi:hypothetical protein